MFLIKYLTFFIKKKNRGTSESAFFFLSRDYWKCIRRNKARRRRSSDIIKKEE